MFLRKQLACICGTAALLAGACQAAHAQCDTSAGPAIEIAGQVIDARALVPVRARVVITAGRDTLAALDADSAGFFSTTLCRRSALVVHFRQLGYRADSLVVPFDGAPWTPLDVAMVPLRQLPAVVQAGSRIPAPRTSAAIEARARRAGGMYIGSEEIERLRPARTSDLLRGRRGIALEAVDGTLRVVSGRSPRPRVTLGSPGLSTDGSTPRIQVGSASCPLRIGMDGDLMSERFRVDEVAVVEIVAIEIYPSGASMPIEFTGVRDSKVCGLVMVWTFAGLGLSP